MTENLFSKIILFLFTTASLGTSAFAGAKVLSQIQPEPVRAMAPVSVVNISSSTPTPSPEPIPLPASFVPTAVPQPSPTPAPTGTPSYHPVSDDDHEEREVLEQAEPEHENTAETDQHQAEIAPHETEPVHE